MNRKRSGFTLVEILIVVVIMAVLAATIIPQFTTSTKDAQASTATFNLNALRSQIEMYKAQHNGLPPTTLDLLTKKTNSDHSVSGTPTLGPYLLAIPENPFNNKNAVDNNSTGTMAAPPSVGASDIGWLYNKTTGDVFINTADYLTE